MHQNKFQNVDAEVVHPFIWYNKSPGESNAIDDNKASDAMFTSIADA